MASSSYKKHKKIGEEEEEEEEDEGETVEEVRLLFLISVDFKLSSCV
jgi:hypothetical protein